MSSDSDKLANAAEAVWRLLVFIWGLSPVVMTFLLMLMLAWALLQLPRLWRGEKHHGP